MTPAETAAGADAGQPVIRAGLGSVALGIAGLTLAARLIGFGRSVVFSKTVGDTCLGDAYNAANSLPNVLFEIVAGGVLAGVVIPVVARHAGAGRRQEATQTVSALLTWTLIILTPAAMLAFLGAGSYGSVFAKPSCAASAETIAALLVMFVPQIWFYGLAVVSAGVLQAYGRFLASALAPLLSSMVVITSYLLYAAIASSGAATDLTRLGRQAAQVLGYGTTLGVLTLAATTLLPTAKLGHRLRPRLRFAAEDRRVIVTIASAAIGGLVAQQLSVVLINWSAQQTGDPGALTRFTWANAIYLLPYAVLAAPLLQLAFPRLSTAAEHGSAAVALVLAEVGPSVVALASLGAALLGATAVPVARVFVLGPGSGDTLALAWPIVALGPAVIGFSVLGLCSRTLLAQHRGGAAGLVTLTGWAAVFGAVLLLRLLAPQSWTVTALAAAVSVGMIAGGALGAVLVSRSKGTSMPWLPRSLLVSLLAAAVSGGLIGWLGHFLRDAGLVAASAAAAGTAVACAAVFAAVLFVADRPLLTAVWGLARRGRTASRS
jgi:putative peptidoglycan lipid II flippase